MGLLADTLARLVEHKALIGAAIPTWQAGVPQYPRANYQRLAQEGYSLNELVYACIEELATSAAEPSLAAYRTVDGQPEAQPDHPLLPLLRRPNPYLDHFGLWAGVILHLQVAGNAYLHKERSRAGKLVELWPLRPDRVRVIPDAQRFIGGYEYRIGDQVFTLPPEDVIHFKLRNPLDDHYGLSPLSVIAPRVDTDNWMRQFTTSFFRNAGVPAGLLNISKSVNAAERQVIAQRFATEYGGPAGWHRLLVLDGAEATYTPMGMPMGERGLAMPTLDEIDEARIAMVFGVPLILIGARLGLQRSTFANYREARASFWDETLAPLYQLLAARLSATLIPDEYDDLDYLAFDLSTVQALQEDQDAKHARIREDAKAGLITRQEARAALGYDPDPDPADVFVRASSLTLAAAKEDPTAAPPPPVLPPGQEVPPATEEDKLRLARAERKLLLMPLAYTRHEQVEDWMQACTNDVAALLAAQQQRVSVRFGAAQKMTMPPLDTLWPSDEREALAEVLLAWYRTVLDEVRAFTSDQFAVPIALSDAQVAEYLREAGQAITGIDATTRAAIRTALLAGEAAADTVPQHAARLRALFAFSRARAETIARTELAQAMNAAALLSYQQSGLVAGVEVLDGDYDAECQAMHGRRLTLAQARSIPRIAHPNCVRAFAPLTETRDLFPTKARQNGRALLPA